MYIKVSFHRIPVFGNYVFGGFRVACPSIRYITSHEKHLKRKSFGTLYSIFFAGGTAAAGGGPGWLAGASGVTADAAGRDAEGNVRVYAICVGSGI